jgi:hypothetical protein
MSPAPLTPEKECYSVLFLHFFQIQLSLLRVSDQLEAPRATGRPIEEVLDQQALNLGLREAVMACLTGKESRRWTVSELVERLKNLGVRASRPA